MLPMPSGERTGFRRIVGHHMIHGKVVSYVLHGHPFQIIVHRDGIEISGQSPMLPEKGLDIFIEVLQLCMVHFRHLASFKPGEVQTILDDLDVKKTVDSLYQKSQPFNALPMPSLIKAN